MGKLRHATALRRVGDELLVDLDPEWEGWGPAGGYLAAIALRATGETVSEHHRPLSLQAQFLFRAERGTATVRVDVLKSGSSAMSNVSLSQSGRVFFQAQVWTTTKTQGPEHRRLSAPITPVPEQLPTLDELFRTIGRAPVTFWSKFDCRPVEFRAPGGPPATTDKLQRWYRFRDETLSTDVFDNAGRAAILLDANIWAAHWRMLEEEPAYAGPSLDLSVWFHDVQTSSKWMMLEAISPVASNGIVFGTAGLWSNDDRLIATGSGNCLIVPFKT